MRSDLQQYEGQRLHFNAQIQRFGRNRRNPKQWTACLHNVRVGSRTIAGHVWIDWPKNKAIVPGTRITFTATVRPYTKKRLQPSRRRGRKRWRKVTDYELARVADIEERVG